MIEAQVERNNEVLMDRMYYEPTLTLEHVVAQLEMYIVKEQLNVAGECLSRVRFPGVNGKTKEL